MSSPAAIDRLYNRAAGEEPLPGYVLIEPLGRGGFGEVWRAEVPGGLHKAIKFVAPDPDLSGSTAGFALHQEFEAFQTIKRIRHPFLLTLERVELVSGELVMVMELADTQLQDRFNQCRQAGQPGVPRNELLAYFADAAEALDVIGTKYGLQHLDVKPANLFLVCGRVKVGDYGLVTRLGSAAETGGLNRGLTPRYVAPEVLRGQIDSRSDQYSLALVYQELLTGTFAYAARTPQQMMLMHVTGQPDLSGLPAADRPAVLRALAKRPEDRFPTCLAFVQALLTGAGAAAGSETMNPSETMFDVVRQARMTQSAAELILGASDSMSDWPPAGGPSADAQGTMRMPRPVREAELPAGPVGTNTQPAKPLPRLTTVQKKPPGFEFPPTVPPPPAAPPPPAEETVDLFLAPAPREPVRLPAIRSVLPVAVLTGAGTDLSSLWADQLIDAVVSAAANGAVPRAAADAVRRPDGSWVCRFPTTLLPTVVPLKLQPLLEGDWFDELDQPGPGVFVLRRYAAVGVWGRMSGKKAGMEVAVRWPTRRGAGEAEAVVSLFGTPDAAFALAAADAVAGVMTELRGVLCNVEDRRKHPRVACDLPVTLYPIDNQGHVLAAVEGRCRDVSVGGLCAVAPVPVPSKYAYTVFGLPGPAGSEGVLLRITRTLATADGHVFAGRFRTDV